MRILHLTTEFPPVIYGGLGTAVGGLVKASATAGITTGVLLFGEFAGGDYGKFVPLPETARGKIATRSDVGATVFEVSWHQGVDAIAQTAAKWRPDILHLHSFWLWPLAQGLRARLGAPLVYTVHSLDRAEYELGQGPAECLTQWVGQESVIASADRVIALTQNERALLNTYCPSVDPRVRVVGNGIEDIPLSPSIGKRASSAPLVLFNGRFVERKGIRELMEAIELVLDQVSEVQFVLAGGHRGCSGAQMESWLLPAQLRSRRAQIQFTGWLTPQQLSDWYRKADVLVVPSWYEPFGMVILEGMLHGVAVAASAVGGPTEILDHERTGLLFRARSSTALA
ncbi:MAG TPA: glycosyltransferase family 4 protein, partial [Terrimicrobiaceae bacterium]|nr:glycosyltransferase family 4 protein [Terrimicrobiaceae bacterium]